MKKKKLLTTFIIAGTLLSLVFPAHSFAKTRLMLTYPGEAASVSEAKNRWFSVVADHYIRFRFELMKAEHIFVPQRQVSKALEGRDHYGVTLSQDDLFTAAKQVKATHLVIQNYFFDKSKNQYSYFVEITNLSDKSITLEFDQSFPFSEIENNLRDLSDQIVKTFKVKPHSSSEKVLTRAALSTNFETLKSYGLSVTQNLKNIDEKTAKKLVKVIEKDPTLAFATYAVAIYYEKQKDCLSAGRYYNQLILRNGFYYPDFYILASKNYRLCQSMDKANRVLKLAEQKGVATPQIYLEQGKIYERLNKHAEANRVYAELLKRNPNQPDALLYVAKKHRESKSYKKAMDLLNRLINTKKSTIPGDAYLELAENLLKLKRNSEAIPALEKAAKLLPNNIRPYTLLGEAFFNKNQYNKASSYYTKALGLDQTNLELLLRTTTSLRRANQSKKALALLMKYKSNFYDTKQVTKEIGLLNFEMKKFAEAKPLLESCLTMKPVDPEVLTALGSMYSAEGDNSRAISMYDRAMSITKDKNLVQAKLASLYIQNREFGKAEKIVKQILAKKPNYPSVNQHNGDILLNKGDTKRALAAYLKERKLHGNNPYLQDKITGLYFQTNNIAMAKKEANALIKMDPKSYQGYYLLTIIATKERKPKKAEAYLKKAESLGKLTASDYLEIGKIFVSAKLYSKALEFYNKSLRLDPKNQTILEAMAGMYLDKKQDSTAARLYEKIYALDPKKNHLSLAKAGNTFYRAGHTDQAYRIYQKFLQQGHKNPLVFLNKAKIEFEKKKYLQVIASLKKVTGHFESKKEVAKLYAFSYYYLNRYGEALPYFKRLPTASFNKRETIELAALCYEKAGDVRAAIPMYVKYLSLKKDAKHQEYTHHLGTLYEKTTQAKKAIAQYEKAIKLYPKDMRNYERLSTIYVDLKKFSLAKRVLAQAVKDPAAPAHLNRILADIYAKSGQAKQAIAKYEAFLKKNPTDKNTLYNLGSLYFAQKSYDKALPHLERASKTMTDNSDIFYSLGVIYSEKNNFAKAATYLKTAYQLNSSDIKILDLLIVAYQETNRLNDLTLLLKKKLAKEPNNAALHFQLGNIYKKTGKNQQAITYLEKATQLKPSEVSAHISLISLYKDNPQKRLTHLNAALKYDPKNVDLQYEQAVLLIEERKSGKAKKALQRLLAISPNHIKGRFAYGVLLKEETRYQQALPHLKKVIQSDSRNAEYLLTYAEVANQLEKHPLALDAMNKVLALDPKNPLYSYQAALFAYKSSDFEKAETLFLKTLSLKNNYENCYKYLGILYSNTGSYDKAITYLQKASQKNTKDDSLLVLLGQVYTKKGQKKRALPYYQKAYKANPNNGEALYNVCNYYITQKRFKEAERIISKESVNGNSPWFAIARGRILEIKKELPKAMNYYKEALQALPSNSDAHLGVGRINLERKRYDQAIQSFGMAMAENPDNLEAFSGMGRAYLAQKNYTAASELFSEVIKRQSKNVEAFKVVGVAYSKMGKHEEALVHLKKAIKLKPKDVDVHFAMAIEYEKVEKYKEALASFNKALVLDKSKAAFIYPRMGDLYFYKLKDPKNAVKYYEKYVAAGGTSKKIKRLITRLKK